MKTRRMQAYDLQVGDTFIRTVTSKIDPDNPITSLFTVTEIQRDWAYSDIWLNGTYDMGAGEKDGFCHLPITARVTLIHRPRKA